VSLILGLVQGTTLSSVTRRGASKVFSVLEMKTCERSGYIVLLFLSFILGTVGWKMSRFDRFNPGEGAAVTLWITTEMNKMKL
jgi:hypothetical protein